MSERDDQDPALDPDEGVRIIGADEAQAALDAGEAAGRRPGDRSRYSDVPPAPSGPRPAHRFPLPHSADPARAVDLPPLAQPSETGQPGERSWSPPPAPAEESYPQQEYPQAGYPQEEYPQRQFPGWQDEPYAGEPYADDPYAGDAYAGADPSSSEPSYAPPSSAEPEPYGEAEPSFSQAPAFDQEEQQPYSYQGGSGWQDDPRPEQSAAYQDRIEELRGWQDEPYDQQTETYGEQTETYGQQTETYGQQTETYGQQTETYGQQTETYGGQQPQAWQAEASGQEEPWKAQAYEEYEDDRDQMEDNRGEQPAWGAGHSDATTELGLSPIPEEGISLTGSHEMPHWSDPPTGEVPRLRLEEDDALEGGDDEAWRALDTSGARWRHDSDWDDLDAVSDLAEDFDPRGALDQTRAEHSDLFSFDADFERVTSSRQHKVISVEDVEAAGGIDEYADEYADEWDVEPEPVAAGPGAPTDSETAEQTVPRPTTTRIPSSQAPGPGRTAGTRLQRSVPATSGGDLGGRLWIGLGLVVLLAICYAIGVQALLVLAVVIVTAAAAEAYNMTRQIGFRPATLVGLVATAGCVLGVYWKGLEAVPIVAALFFGATMLWFVLGVERARPLVNVAVTVMVFVWVAVLGSFAAVLLNRPHGRGAFLGAVVVAVVADILAYVIGRWIGNRPIAPKISPNKTIEGYVAGVVGAIIVGLIIGKELAPWGGLRHGLVLGLLIGLIAPAGDLFESLLKRDIGLKDSGSVLAGHGGLLDRFDAILLALPLAYFVLAYFRLA